MGPFISFDKLNRIEKALVIAFIYCVMIPLDFVGKVFRK
jgi:hypothetical protein